MKRKIILPVALVIVIILALLSPFAVHKIQNLFIDDKIEIVDSFSSEKITLQKNNFIYFGNYLDEPVLWEVLDVKDGKVLLMSEHIICFKAFDVCGKSENFHQSDSEKYGSSVWENSTLKEWLNSDEKNVSYSHCPPAENSTFDSQNIYHNESGFLYEDNFSSFEKSLISEDGVFILNKAQLKKHFDNTTRRKSCTASSIKQNDSPYFVIPNKSMWYWTSSPVSSNNVSVASVTSSGTFYKSLAYDGAMGVSPALYLSTSTVEVYAGNGSKEYPYILEMQ